MFLVFSIQYFRRNHRLPPVDRIGFFVRAIRLAVLIDTAVVDFILMRCAENRYALFR